ncbi:MAG TPA: PQQ-dependent sugar dehydrogenase [Rubrobacter sp.]|nr:PQQ-dependent sugar dehydrogenase [Rubrobacter sp.]
MVGVSNSKVWAVVVAAMVAAMVIALMWFEVEPARSATSVPTGLTDSVVAQVNKPTSMTVAPDGRLLVTQKASNNVGKVRVIKNGQLLSKPFLKVDTDTSYFRGVLGITLDPNFSTNHYVYIFYTATSPTVHNRVSRFTANGDVAVAGSEKVLLDLPTLGTSGGHYGGALRFGADGKLYIGVGDDVTPADTQSLNIVNGKVLRINPDGTIPSDNPFYVSTSGNNRAIYALGVRQPYSLDVLSGTLLKLYINDVGEDSWEEIDQAVSAANYGWPTYEGFVASPDPSLQNYQNPVFYYAHGTTLDTGCSITGGAFYDPATTRLPSQYQGKYFYADYCGGWIRYIDPADTRTSYPFASGMVKPVDLEVGDNGSLYYLSYGSSTAPASVHEIH